LKVRLAIYDEYDSNLLKFKTLWSTLDLEIKDPVTGFEEYNSNWLYIKTLQWQAENSFDFSKPGSYPTQVIKVDTKQEKVSDLELKISELYGIPLEKLVICLAHEHAYNSSVTCEFYNMDWRKDKLICESGKLEHGVTLFVEENDPKSDFNLFKWKLEFEKASEKISISLNDINNPDSMDFPLKVSVDRSDTIKQLKQVISQRISLDPSEFYLVRNSTSQEIKELNKTLVSLGLVNGAMIKIVKG